MNRKEVLARPQKRNLIEFQAQLRVTYPTRRIPLRLRLGPRDGIGATTQMVTGTAVMARARLSNVEGFFYLLPLRGETAGRGGLGDCRSRGARGGIELSRADRRRRPFPLAGSD
jgi:hypothetical protein